MFKKINKSFILGLVLALMSQLVIGGINKVSAASAFLPGDVDGNGQVQAYDASLISQHLTGQITLTPDQLSAAEVTSEGEVTGLDADVIGNYAVGIVSELPVLFGDVSGNGIVSAYDASLVAQYVSGTRELSNHQEYVADVNLDGQIANDDAELIAKRAADILDYLPIQPDLVVEDVVFNKTWSIRDNILTAEVCNNGTEVVEWTEVHTQFTLNGIRKIHTRSGSFGVGECKTDFMPIASFGPSVGAGYYDIKVEVDTDHINYSRSNQVDEFSEANNALTKNLYLGLGASKPDLSVENFEFTDLRQTDIEQWDIQLEFDLVNIGEVRPNHDFKLTVKNLSNNNMVIREEVYGHIYFTPNDYRVRVSVVGNVGEEFVEGVNEIEILVDADNSVDEIREDNNKLNQVVDVDRYLQYVWEDNTTAEHYAYCDQSTDCVDSSNQCHDSGTQPWSNKRYVCKENKWYLCQLPQHLGKEVFDYVCVGDVSWPHWEPEGSGNIKPEDEYSCSDGYDNDGDQLIDNEDPDCASTAKPDLTVESMSISRQNNQVNIDYCVKNIGQADSGEFSYKYENLNNPNWDFGGGTYNMPAGQEYCHSLSWSGVGDNGGNGYVIGENRIRLTVDSNDTVAESNEANNTYISTLTIGQVKPDFIIKDMAIKKNTTDNKYYIFATFKNIGVQSEAKTMTIEVIDTGNMNKYYQSVGGSNFPNNYEYELQMSDPLVLNSSGVYNLLAKADYYDVFDESNEDNNSLTEQVVVGMTSLAYDWSLSNLQLEQNAYQTNESINFSYQITNQGTEPYAVEYRVDMYWDGNLVKTLQYWSPNEILAPGEMEVYGGALDGDYVSQVGNHELKLELKVNGSDFNLDNNVVKEILTIDNGGDDLAKRLGGYILLATQDKGRVYYVSTENYKKYEVTFGNLLNLFEELALGITHQNLNKIPINIRSMDEKMDSDGDGYNDKLEVAYGHNPFGPGRLGPYDYNMSNRLKGRILLDVDQNGQIWYVDMDARRWQVTWSNAMNLFINLALGITNEDLAKIENGN